MKVYVGLRYRINQLTGDHHKGFEGEHIATIWQIDESNYNYTRCTCGNQWRWLGDKVSLPLVLDSRACIKLNCLCGGTVV